MGYSIRIVDKFTRETLMLNARHEIRGGTYELGGTCEAWLDVTYNYSKYFERVLGKSGIRTLYESSSKESLPLLRDCIEKLEGYPSLDYWEATEGNARQALISLYSLALLYPDGIWSGD